MSLARLTVFHMDECLDWQGRPLPKDHPYNFRTFMERHFYGGIPPALNVPEAQRLWLLPSTMERVREAIAEAPLDLTLGGWGQDGHVAYNQARRHPFLRVGLEELAASTIRVQENNLDTILALAHRTFGAAYQFVPPDVGHARDEGVPLRREGAGLQRHRQLEADRAASGALLRAGGGVPDDAAAAAPRRARHRDARDRPAPDQREPGMGVAVKTDSPPRALRLTPDAPFRRLVGVGGVGAGIFFALEGNHDLGRNESRPGRLLDVRDYCKLHIVAQYPAVLLGARGDQGPFHVVPVGKVGIDEVGLRLRAEMERSGMDVRFVDAVPGHPTLLSVCFQYPDGSGGNVTTVDSAAALLSERDVDLVGAMAVSERPGSRALPRCRSRSAATCCAGRRRGEPSASPRSPRPRSRRRGETGFLSARRPPVAERGRGRGARRRALSRTRLRSRSCGASSSAALGPSRACASSSPRARGAPSPSTAPPGRTRPTLPVPVVSTAGAGDALLGGVLAGLALGLPFAPAGGPRATLAARPLSSALELGALVAAFKVTSPHTIPPDLSLDALLAFAREHGVVLGEGLRRLLPADEEHRHAS